MNIKLDENLGTRGAEILRRYGHEVKTVVDESLQSCSDTDLIQRCRSEKRCLVTLNMDFSNPTQFPPVDYPGIAVLRLPRESSPAILYELTTTLAQSLKKRDISGKLWIIQGAGIREYQADEYLY